MPKKGRKQNRISPSHPDPQAVAAALVQEVAQRFFNTGYSGGGASTKKNYSRGWEWQGGSPVEDISKNIDVLRQRSRDLFMNSGIGRSAITRICDNSVGVGLRLQSTPNAEMLGITAEEASTFARKMEWEFNLWANSRDCDSTGLNTFEELQAVALLSWLQSGDCFALLPMRDYGGPYELKIHLIEADRVSDPQNKPTGVKLDNGAELDQYGRVVAYWVNRQHPLTKDFGGDRGFDRIPVRDAATGRTNIVHMIRIERPEQHRGVPLLAPVIENLKQLTRYGEAELMAAVVASLFTIFVKSQTPQSPLGESLPEIDKVTTGQYDEDYHYELGPGAVVGLGENEDITIANPTRPNSAFEAFVKSVSREVGAALSIPYEVLLQAFTASYSASRAALLSFWKTALIWRAGMVRNFCQPVFEEFAWEAVLKGRVDAPGFVDDPSIRAAWLASRWHGPAMGQIDPLKEAQAAEKRMDI
ncbi:MAG: phage portal protein, partial [Armatimonadota bacterium]